VNAGGERTDEQVSVPVPTTARLLATAAAVPPLDPDGRRSRAYGLCVSPPSELTESTPSARLAKSLDDGRVRLGDELGEPNRPRRRRHVRRIVVVFDRDRNPVERPREPVRRESSVQLACPVHRRLVGREDRVERVVVSLDAVEERLDEPRGRERRLLERRVDRRDGGFCELEVGRDRSVGHLFGQTDGASIALSAAGTHFVSIILTVM
jgi:hypothetical protein